MSKISIKEPSVVIREKRLGTINAFTGTASQIVEKSAKGELKDCKRKFSQCLGCNQQQAFCQLAMIRDAAVINHAPIGCAGEFADFNFTYRVEQARRGLPSQLGRYFCTNLLEKDTVFGASRKLEETIRLAYDRVHPNAIFVTTSCASGIIGEDIEAVVDAASEELGIPVVTCNCEGFRSKIWTTGFDAAYHTVLRGIVKPSEKKSNKINIINKQTRTIKCIFCRFLN